MSLQASELILNPDGSVYHLHLKPENIAETIITVGDPDRVSEVSKFFDKIDFKIQKREFHTQTGWFKNKRFTVISTGIGTDNIDIVLNELDALVNIDLKKRTVKKSLTRLQIIRIGTSGALQKNIPLDSFLVSEKAIGFDSLLHYYKDFKNDEEFCSAVHDHLKSKKLGKPYIVSSAKNLKDLFIEDKRFLKGITATNVGFYAPQGRALRAKLFQENYIEKLQSFLYKNQKIVNLEMETSGIYGLAKVLGHQAISLNAIMANRATGEFSTNPKLTMDKLILSALNKLT